MPPPPMTAAIFEQSAEAATATQAFEGAEVNVQYWPRAEEAAKQRLPAAVVTRRRNLFFTIAQLPAAMCKSARINRLGPGAERLIYPAPFLARGGLAVNRNRACRNRAYAELCENLKPQRQLRSIGLAKGGGGKLRAGF